MKILGVLLVGMLAFSSCEKKLDQTENNQEAIDPVDVTMDNLEAAPAFDWENTQDAQVVIYTKDNAGHPVPNVKVSVKTGFEEDGGQFIISGQTNESGVLELDYNFEADVEELVLSTDYLGFVPEVLVPISNGLLSFTFGGERESFLAQDFGEAPFKKSIESALKSGLNTNITINYLGTYDSEGVPDYLEAEGDYLSPEFLSDINDALPEISVPIYHPEYLLGVNEHNLVILDEADVWVTFVSEGAGYRNVLAFYTYDRDFPPQSADDITECTVIFPNSSFAGSGGGLYPGDKVKIGTFPENTVVGWVLLRNGWSSSSQQVTEGLGLVYSNQEANPEPNDDDKQHCILLYDADRELFVIGFEDLIRPGGDNDFNDAVFYATANPIENVEMENVQPAYPDPIDTDGDGIYDGFDDYPEDPDLAFNNYYASSGLYGTLAFEDLWPSKGDYDFNDLVVDYNFNRISNADNMVVTLQGKFVVRAIGASFRNGFGFTIEGVDPSVIESVTGTEYTEGYIQTNNNGTEAGQSSATIIVFDNAWKHGSGNTKQGEAFIVPDTITVNINLVTPVGADDFGVAPFNPFIIVNKERGKEVHLANYPPSDLVDETYFGQAFDDTQPEIGKYYKTEENLPWAVNFPSKFQYPVETVSIDLGHLKFVSWVLSEGEDYKNWYKDIAGYRNAANIYQE
ncbi:MULTISPECIES: LruC domain-containing protein [unclassified Lentimicrobium]|uniref:LruC domain-containing protein n=1 Tax=unclassified Lentimicrobium TaxID=2677434 RepID=UPI001551BDE3|nr:MULTISPECIES: LruC domain-containing protein [unclassified Lentimicrobium]NPD48186.1 LruC domain-containing protein [Lentimicrobium sp. S6]NPD86500.1 LruC domain-containing protein [Lentimicrobium sp. L6]